MGKEYEIEKLRGSENYNDWTFAMQSYLEVKSLSKCIIDTVNKEGKSETETDTARLAQCKATIILNIDTKLYKYVRNLTSALEIWQCLKKKFEDTGLCRRTAILQSLVSCKLENYNSISEYANDVTDFAQKLNSIGFQVSDDWISGILLAGLTQEYKPFIMGMQAAGNELIPSAIVAQLEDFEVKENRGEAFLSTSRRKNSQIKNMNIKCHFCNKKGHIKKNCFSFKKQRETKKSTDNAYYAFSAYTLKKQETNSINVEVKNENKAIIGLMAVNERKNSWFLDSGASSHMTPDKNILQNIQTSDVKKISVANDATMTCDEKGSTVMKINKSNVYIKDVLHIPQLAHNLLSVFKLTENGNEIIFNKTGCTIRNVNNGRNDILTIIKPENGVYKIESEISNMCLISKTNENAMMWHRRLGHMNYADLRKMRDGVVTGIAFSDDKSQLKNCEVCCAGKQARTSFHSSKNKRAENVLDLIHSDLCGPMESSSIGGVKYFLTFIDDHSRKVFTYFVHFKSQVLSIFVNFKVMIENQTGRKIKSIRTDNGGEYMSKAFHTYFRENGIKHQTTVAYTPEQNGRAERMNRTLVERAKCMLFDANMDKCYWAEAVNMATFIINHSVNSILVDKTPEEIWTGQKVSLENLKLFGCNVMVHVPKQKRRKWDKKSIKMIFTGYDDASKAYRCIDPKTRKLHLSRDVIFHEPLEHQVNPISIEPLSEEIKIVNDHHNAGTFDEKIEKEKNDISTVEISDDSVSIDNDSENLIDDESCVDDSRDVDYVPKGEIKPSVSKRTTRATTKSGNWWYANLAVVCDADLALRCNEESHADDPININDLNNREDSEKWICAMKDEIKSLEENKTWNLVELPKEKKVIKTKWIFKTKRNVDGDITRFKARLVARGYTQRYGVDYEETYAPVVRYTTVRVLMALAVRKKLQIYQMDAVTAFLQGDIDEEIYIEQPEGFRDNTNRVCKLNKALYGLKQAGRQWNIKLDRTLKGYGLKSCYMDPCLYYDENMDLIIAIYVDDLLIFYRDEKILLKIKTSLSNDFKMKDMGQAKGCLGIRITQTEDSIKLDQSIYIIEVLKRFGMMDSKQSNNPSDVGTKLSMNMTPDGHEKIADSNIPYQQAVGCLLFIARATRPDIAFAVGNVSRYNNCYSESHWKAVKRIMRFLRATINVKLCYANKSLTNLSGYADADWASDIDSRKSCTGYVFKMSHGAISWSSNKQRTVALSSTEAEYIALTATIQEGIWLQQLCAEIGIDSDHVITIFCDNQSAIALAESDGYRQRTKHIDIRLHFIRNLIKDGKIRLSYIETNKNVADALTKPVTNQKLKLCSEEMGLML